MPIPTPLTEAGGKGHPLDKAQHPIAVKSPTEVEGFKQLGWGE